MSGNEAVETNRENTPPTPDPTVDGQLQASKTPCPIIDPAVQAGSPPQPPSDALPSASGNGNDPLPSSGNDLPPPTDTDTLPLSDAKTTAESILKWAKDHHLFARQPVDEDTDVIESDNVPIIAAAQMFAVPQVEQVLRHRAINLITFNNEASKVVIFTKSKVTSGDLKILPFASKGVAIEYATGGVPTVKGDIPQTHHERPFFLHQGRYCCGSSVFPANCIGAGTLGFLARDGSGQLYGVTNNHVTGACNHAHPGLPILAPGPLDVSDDGINPFCIGRHSRLIPINDGIPENMDISNNLDASCFLIADHAGVSSMQGNVCDTPMQVEEPTSGGIVEKIGRTTGFTRGRIVGQSVAPISVSYVLNEYGIRKSVYFQTVFIVEGLQGDFSKRGDSGSLVMGWKPDGSRTSVGLVFAGDEQKKLTFILPLPNIMEKLELTVCNGHNI